MAIWRFFKNKKAFWWPVFSVLAFIFAFVAYLFLNLPGISHLKTKNPKTTALIEMRTDQARKEKKDLAIRQSWVPFANIPQLLKDTVRIAEDAGFYQHKGIDFEELKEAIKKNIQEKKFTRGGSTITQQLAKNLYLSPKKNLMRKIKEYLIARRLEKNLSKERIFELYLNVIELGPGIFGIQAASRYYFGCDVDELSLEETVRLVGVLPRPLIEDPLGNSEWLKWRCRWLLHKLQLYNFISVDNYEEVVKPFLETPR
jgi:monofunctional biosynthetic peptidoglycan transglycosylase